MRTARHPNLRLVLLSLQLPRGIELEKLRVQRTLKKAERQLVDGDVGLR